MEIKKIPFEEIRQFSERDKAYTLNPEIFKDLIEDIPSLESLRKKIDSRSKFPINREILTKRIKEQYPAELLSPSVEKNITALKNPNCYTVTTAHQPGLFTGPLYYIIKILSTIKLSEVLNESYPDFHFVPCFISGGEDHDFEEINHTYLFGNKLEWETDQEGSCGRMSLDGIEASIEMLYTKLGSSDNAEELKSLIAKSKAQSLSYGEFSRNLVKKLFKDHGLLVISMDDAQLKSEFADIIEKELTTEFSHKTVSNQIAKIQELGFKSQADPREINLFYLTGNDRRRIVKENEHYTIAGGTEKFTQEEILTELKNNPERFSPNVIMRPLYQERILPNLAYIGGGGEIAYWIERKEQFKEASISYPILIRRNSAGIIDRKKMKVWDDLGFKLSDFNYTTDQLKKQFTLSSNTLPQSLIEGKEKASKIYEALAEDVLSIDPSIQKSVLAEAQKNKKSFEMIESKLIKHFKQKEEVSLKRIAKTQDYLYPNDGLQERKANFMEFYLREGKGLFTELKNELNPLNTDFTLFIME
jgi:bacillithiol biosynthesis cysteine-adding enzyme BshC